MKKFQRIAQKQNEIHTVFVESMMDFFEKPMPVVDLKGNPITEFNGITGSYLTTGHLRNYFFENIVPNSPNLLFQLLTKRPSNINKYIPYSWKKDPPSNVLFGTSPVNQEIFNKLVNQLRDVNGKRFLSIEPQLYEINELDLTGIDWVIQGGESGHHKRPYNLEWARFTRDECKRKNIPYFLNRLIRFKLFLKIY